MSKKIIATNLLLTLPFSLLSLQIHAAMTQNSPDKIIVTASPSQDPQEPISGLVATKTLSTNKILSDIDKTPQSISVITRDQMDAQDVSSVSQALRYTPAFSLNIAAVQTEMMKSLFVDIAMPPVFLMDLVMVWEPHLLQELLTLGY